MILPGFKQMMTKLTTNSNVVSETQPNLVTRKLRQPDLKPLPRCIKHCYSDDAVHVVIAFLRPKLLQGGARPFPCIISKSIRRLRRRSGGTSKKTEGTFGSKILKRNYGVTSRGQRAATSQIM